MDRRTFLRRTGAAGVVGSGLAGGAAAESTRTTEGQAATRTTTAGSRGTATDTLGPLLFDSTCSLLNADGEPLTNDEYVPVRAAETARVTDEDGDGDATSYEDSGVAPALAAVDGGVFGIGAPFVADADAEWGNEEFLRNVWDELAGEGTILWDEGHEQFYTLDEFAAFRGYVESGPYTVTPTTDLQANLDGAAGIVITSPSAAFTDAELDALASFVADGGAVFLHSQSDYNDFDETDNVNEIAAALDAPFRFDDCQVADDESNGGSFFQPTTTNVDTSFPFFEPREGRATGPEFSFDEEYTATITDVADGDTFTVQFESGATEDVRVLGVDTPETPANADAENPHEWEGLGDQASSPEQDGDYPYLSAEGAEASEFAIGELADATVTLTFDENEGIEDPFGRILAYAHYDADGSGSRDTLWARRLLEEGYARVYDSGLARHDELLQTELTARAEGRGLWAESDPDASRTVRDGAVESLYLPNAVPVESFGGELPDERVAVRAGESASEPGAPLVAVDPDNRLALVGAPPVEDDHVDEVFDGERDAYDNETFLTNLATALADRDGDVLWDGGHGQFGNDPGESVEGVAHYQRFLEGVDVGLEQVNDYELDGGLDGSLLARGRALVVTPPSRAFTPAEREAVTAFRDAGGAVILVGTAEHTEATSTVNGLAAALGSDLSFGRTGVTDPDANRGEPSQLVTDAFGESFGLFASVADGDPTLQAETPTPTATEASATETETSAGGEDAGEATATSTSAPGLGTLSGVAGLLGGGLYALRSAVGEDGDDSESE
ncbi:thermonuclease family protein [Halobaculum sp. MBLA0147]|uniref:thermonuclease family protein n=1 Tax=Halobaculum sp. MBLA0147 TaxID=3079934 RepID=UPI003524C1FB